MTVNYAKLLQQKERRGAFTGVSGCVEEFQAVLKCIRLCWLIRVKYEQTAHVPGIQHYKIEN